ncbi:hypothetical protein Tco_1363937, partial [Tanacetum coccineum]
PQSSGPTEPIADEAANEENVPTHSNDLILSGKDSLKLNELIELCTNLQNKILDLETSNTAQAQEITSLKKRVKKLEKRNRSRTHGLKSLYKVGLSAKVVSSEDEGLDEEDASKHGRKPSDAIDEDDNIILVNDAMNDDLMFDTSEEEEERLAREKAQHIEDANIAWDDIQEKIDADYQLAERLQAEEQEQLTNVEKAKLFCEFLEKRRKFFAAKSAEAKRNKPPTQAQQRKLYSTYLKNMEGFKLNQLKNKSFDDIQKLFNKAMKKVNAFVDMDSELVKESSKKAKAEIAQKSSSKRAGEELEQESSKKQKIDDEEETTEVDEDKETVEFQSLFEIVPDDADDIAIDAIPLATKPPSICLEALIEKIWKLYGNCRRRIEESTRKQSVNLEVD